MEPDYSNIKTLVQFSEVPTQAKAAILIDYNLESNFSQWREFWVEIQQRQSH